jgi:hypothetical protein
MEPVRCFRVQRAGLWMLLLLIGDLPDGVETQTPVPPSPRGPPQGSPPTPRSASQRRGKEMV